MLPSGIVRCFCPPGYSGLGVGPVGCLPGSGSGQGPVAPTPPSGGERLSETTLQVLTDQPVIFLAIRNRTEE